MGEWDAPVKAVRTRKRRGLRILGLGCGALAVLVVAGYFLATSGWFLKAVVLPRLSAGLGATVTVENIAWSPFSAIKLTGFKVQSKGTDPLVRAERVLIRYSLFALLRGGVQVAEASLESPVVQVVVKADGTSNLGAILISMRGEAKPPATSEPATGEAPPFHVEQVTVKNGTLRLVKALPTGGNQVAEITQLQVAADQLGRGSAGHLEVAADLRWDEGMASRSNGVLAAKLGAKVDFDLDASLRPASLKGSVELAVAEALGLYGAAAGVRATLDADMSATETRVLALRLFKGASPLGTLSASGPFDPARLDGRLQLVLEGIDRQALNLAGALFGGDFNATRVNSTNVVELAEGAKIAVNGQVAVNQFSLTRTGLTTPVLDMAATYQVTVEPASRRAGLQAFAVKVTQNQSDLFRAGLAKPMRLDWGAGTNAVEESAFALALSGLNLADWRAFTDDSALAGQLDFRLEAQAEQAGKKLKLAGEAGLANFATRIGSNRLDHAGLKLTFGAEVADFNRFRLTVFDAQATHERETALRLGVFGQVDVKNADVDLQTALEASIPRLAALLGDPRVKASSGVFKFEGRVQQKPPGLPLGNQAIPDRSVVGTLRLGELTGEFGAYDFDRFETRVACDVSVKNQVVEIKKFSAEARQSDQPGGTFELGGTYDLNKTNGQAAFHLADLNQTVLRSFAAPFLGANKLESLSINGNGNATFDPRAESSIAGNFQAGNLVITDPAGRWPKTPATLRVEFEGALKEDLIEVRRCVGGIDQDNLNGGKFDARGRFNLKTQAGQGSVKFSELNQRLLQPILDPALGGRSLSSAALELKADASYDPKGDSTLKGELQALNWLVTDPAGKLPKVPLSAVVKLEGLWHGGAGEIRQFIGYVKQGELLGGSFDVRGGYDGTRQTGQAEIRVTDLNQNALAPWLGGVLGGQTLESVSINLNGAGRYDAKGESAVKGELHVANLVVKDPSGRLPATPLALDLQLDGSLTSTGLELRQCQLGLNETLRARNQFQLTGTLEITPANPVSGNLKLTAESLDLTPCFDLAMNARKADGNPPGAGPRSASTAPPTEPAAIRLPVGSLRLDAAIGHLYLREIEVANLATTLKIEHNQVSADPFSLVLNEAPVSLRGSVNLGVPGYEYDLNLSARRVPVEPIMNSFEIGPRGRLGGFMAADATLSGAGLTPASLAKHLAGNAGVSLTNANLQLGGGTAESKEGSPLSGFLSGVFKTIALVLRIPDLTRSPLDYLEVRGDVAAGVVNLRSLLLQSAAFQATCSGAITLADPLETSRLNNLPVDIALERATAVKARLASSTTDPGLAYVKLPNFIKVGGTPARAEVKTDKLVLSSLLLKTGTGALEGANGTATDVLSGAGAALPGEVPAGAIAAPAPPPIVPAVPKLPTPPKFP